MMAVSTWTEVIPREDIPIVIICHNLLSDLRRLVAWLEAAGHKRIILLDNASTYPLLLDYLHKTSHDVIRSPENLGHKAPWLCGLLDKIGHSLPFVVSDPDILPDDTCPHDAVEHFQNLLLQHKAFDKAGFGLHIDDIPPCYPHRSLVRRWEQPFWDNEVATNVFAAHIDTTFAIYRPGTPYKVTEALRTGAPYLARHLPWYRDPRHPDPETAYYFEHRSPTVGYWNRIEPPSTKNSSTRKELE